MELVFANSFGGASKTESAPMIHAKLLELRKEISSLAAEKKNGVMFPVRGAKELNQKLANALAKLDLLAPVVAQEVVFIDADKIPPKPDGKPAFRTLVHVKATVRIMAPDGSYIDMVGSGHGGDGDDKAGGKASTYAWKDAILKGLTIPHEDMIDTDDEDQKAPVKFSDARSVEISKVTVTEKPTGASEHPIIAQLRTAPSLDALEKLKNDFASGKEKLQGGDKLKAASAYVERKKELGG